METTIVYIIGIIILGFRVRILKCRPATPKVWHGDLDKYCRSLRSLLPLLAMIEDMYLSGAIVISLMSSSP